MVHSRQTNMHTLGVNLSKFSQVYSLGMAQVVGYFLDVGVVWATRDRDFDKLDSTLPILRGAVENIFSFRNTISGDHTYFDLLFKQDACIHVYQTPMLRDTCHSIFQNLTSNGVAYVWPPMYRIIITVLLAQGRYKDTPVARFCSIMRINTPSVFMTNSFYGCIMENTSVTSLLYYTYFVYASTMESIWLAYSSTFTQILDSLNIVAFKVGYILLFCCLCMGWGIIFMVEDSRFRSSLQMISHVPSLSLHKNIKIIEIIK